MGILQRGLFDGLRHFGGGGLIVLFGLLGTLANIDSAFNTFFVGIIRLLPILVVAQYVLLQWPRRVGDVPFRVERSVVAAPWEHLVGRGAVPHASRH